MILFDCIIIGGGPAGLSAAIYLGRFRRSVLILDNGYGRLNSAEINENYLGFPDGIPTRKLRELGVKQAKKFGAKIILEAVSSVTKIAQGFSLKTEKNNYHSKAIILATGVSDLFPHFRSYEACIGKSLFWCLTCDGHKVIDKKVMVIGEDDNAVSTALQLLNFTKNICFITNKYFARHHISNKNLTRLKLHKIPFYEDELKDVKSTKGMIESVTLKSNKKINTDFIFNQQGAMPNSYLAKELGVKLSKDNYILVNKDQKTNRKGVYAAGDVTRVFSHQIVTASHEGSMAAQAANYDLYAEWQKG